MEGFLQAAPNGQLPSFSFFSFNLSLSLSLALRLSVSLRKEGHKTLLRRAAASGVLRPLGDSHKIFRPLKDGFALFFVLLSEGWPKDPSSPYEGPRTLRFSIPSRSSQGPCALREERVGLLGSPLPLRGQKICASDGRVGENGAPGCSFSGNVWREIEALAAEAQNLAERGFNPRTSGLRAQHANHCATPLWFAEIFRE